MAKRKKVVKFRHKFYRIFFYMFVYIFSRLKGYRVKNHFKIRKGESYIILSNHQTDFDGKASYNMFKPTNHEENSHIDSSNSESSSPLANSSSSLSSSSSSIFQTTSSSSLIYIEFNEDSAGVYSTINYSQHDYIMRYKMELLWQYKNESNVVVIGSSRPMDAVISNNFSEQFNVVNLAQTPNSIYGSRDFFKNYIYRHFSKMKYLIILNTFE